MSMNMFQATNKRIIVRFIYFLNGKLTTRFLPLRNENTSVAIFFQKYPRLLPKRTLREISKRKAYSLNLRYPNFEPSVTRIRPKSKFHIERMVEFYINVKPLPTETAPFKGVGTPITLISLADVEAGQDVLRLTGRARITAGIAPCGRPKGTALIGETNPVDQVVVVSVEVKAHGARVRMFL
jgi:hypothetical protein